MDLPPPLEELRRRDYLDLKSKKFLISCFLGKSGKCEKTDLPCLGWRFIDGIGETVGAPQGKCPLLKGKNRWIDL
jgi:hypothetical protein